MRKYCSRLVLFLLAVAAACVAQSGDVSLGELARKAKTKQKSEIVFNDDNMQRSAVTDQDTGSGSAASAGSPEAKSSGSDASTADKKDGKKDEAKKSSSSPANDNVSKLQKKLDSLKQEQSVWSKSAKNYEDKLANETDEFRRQMYEEAMANDKSNVQTYQRRIDETEGELAKAQQQQNDSADKPDDSTQPPENH